MPAEELLRVSHYRRLVSRPMPRSSILAIKPRSVVPRPWRYALRLHMAL